MASVNLVILVGYLGRDPETRTFPSGDKIVNVTIATTDKWKDKQSGELKEATEWHRVVFLNRLADIAAQYLRTGSQVYIEGSLRTRKWTDQGGVERYSTEVRADEMQMLGRKNDSSHQSDDHVRGQHQASRPASATPPSRSPSTTPRQAPQPTRSASGFNDEMDDIPFRDPFGNRAFCLAA